MSPAVGTKRAPPAPLIYAIGLKRRSLFCLSSKKESRNLPCFLPLRLSQSEKNALAERYACRLLDRARITYGLKNPLPHFFLNFETRLSNIII